MTKAPEKIYVNLDTYEGNGGEWLDFRDFDNDVEYIRKDIFDELLKRYNEMQEMYVEADKEKELAKRLLKFL